MQAVALANGVTFVLTGLLIAVTLVKSPPARNVRNLLLLLLLGLLIWSGGAVWRAVAPNHAQMIAAHNLVFLGVTLVPTTWILLAAAATRLEFFETRPDAAMWIVAPAILVYMGWLTNDLHGHYAHIDFQVFERGPLFWAMVAWAFLCSASGSVFFLRRARTMALADERRGAYILIAVAVFPQLVASTYLFHWIAWPFDPTPASLGISAALLYPVILRLRTLEDLPLVRRDVIEQLRDAVFISDANGRVVDHNPAAHEVFTTFHGLRGRILGELIAEVQGESEAGEAPEPFSEAVPADADITTADGRTLRLHRGLVPGQQGRSLGSYLIVRDVSQEQRAEQAVRQAMRLESVGMLATGVAHELNNPLAFVRANLGHLSKGCGMIGSLGLLEPGEAGHASDNESDGRMIGPIDAAVVECLEEMPDVLDETIRGIDRIADIVADMQSLSQTRSLSRQPVDLNLLIDEAWRGVNRQKRPPCGCELRLAASLPLTLGSGPDLVQALLNLLVNARQAVEASPDPMIRLTTEQRGQEVVLSIEDNGPGIPAEQRERVFDPFFTTREPGEGTGLGLSIAFDIVREHGGRIEADRSELGGAHFSVRLPVAGSDDRGVDEVPPTRG